MSTKINFLTFKSLVTFLILLQILVYMLIFGPISLSRFNLDINLAGDFPSYWLFDFSNLELILSQHRTFGFPLILKIYRLFDYNLIFWPKFTFVLFSLSNIFLFYSLNIFNFNKIFSLCFILGLTLSHELYMYLSWWTELCSVSF